MASRAWLLAPAVAFVAVACLLPLALLAVFSVFRTDDMDLVPAFSGHSWAELFTTPTYAVLVGRSVLAGLVTAVLTAAAGYPVALALARLPRAWAGLALTVLLTPLYTGELVRLYAWRLVLGAGGLLNSFLLWAGLVDAPVQALLFSRFSTGVALFYNNLPYMVLALWVSAAQVDRRLVEAARDLGARPVQAFLRVTLPLTVPGLAAGAFVTFALAAGDLLTPAILGGTTGATAMAMVSTLFGTAFDWPMASVLSLALLGVLALAAAALTWVVSGSRGGRAVLAGRG